MAARVARRSYGKLIAILASKTRDLVAAEEALAEAFARALATWPNSGVPDNPEGWLVQVARNADHDRRRSAAERHRAPLEDADEDAHSLLGTLANAPRGPFADRRVDLLFVCAHPAIHEGVRTPLMLQCVLGIEVKAMATAYVMPAATLAQRLVRAKRKIKQARLRFDVPDASTLPERLDSVLEAIYGAYALDWASLEDGAADHRGEALYLAHILSERQPTAEVFGLKALLCFLSARHETRFDDDGALVPLSEQAPERWDAQLITIGEQALGRAASMGEPGRFQLEAAIQANHCLRLHGHAVDWRRIVDLYGAILALVPTLGATVAHAAAVGEAYGPAAGLRALDAIDHSDQLRRFQPYWATRAHLLHRSKAEDQALEALSRAISLCTDVPLQRYLRNKRSEWQLLPRP